jgi:hypothetical protein
MNPGVLPFHHFQLMEKSNRKHKPGDLHRNRFGPGRRPAGGGGGGGDAGAGRSGDLPAGLPQRIRDPSVSSSTHQIQLCRHSQLNRAGSGVRCKLLTSHLSSPQTPDSSPPPPTALPHSTPQHPADPQAPAHRIFIILHPGRLRRREARGRLLGRRRWTAVRSRRLERSGGGRGRSRGGRAAAADRVLDLRALAEVGGAGPGWVRAAAYVVGPCWVQVNSVTCDRSGQNWTTANHRVTEITTTTPSAAAAVARPPDAGPPAPAAALS